MHFIIVVALIVFGFLFFNAKGGSDESVGETLEVLSGQRAYSCEASADAVVQNKLAREFSVSEDSVKKSDYRILGIETVTSSKEVNTCEIKIKSQGEKYIVTYNVMIGDEIGSFWTMFSTIDKIVDEE
ncbi:Uncharacterised protein [Moraxella caprae]|uniref:Uncharacterized protein n=1 Tax=Moraxella caprae TaxID=90240 RepID=A0A378QWY4_9GAMM|nr:hypothetical protein [Moraxella caprae]STZ07494.1 Uncharacterised protein [Moraxella caprae]